MAENIIIPASEITGDVTSCKIERQLLEIERASALSLQEKSTYISYDVCNRQILAEYVVPELSGCGWVIFFAVIVALVLGIVSRAANI